MNERCYTSCRSFKGPRNALQKAFFSLLLLSSMLPFVMMVPVLAANISGAQYGGSITITSSNATAADWVVVVFPLNTQQLINDNYINPNCNNTAVLTSGGTDVNYMPAPGNATYWAVLVPSIPASTSLQYKLYTGGPAMNGTLVYIPDYAGMYSPDNATLELGKNWSIEQKGIIDTRTSGFEPKFLAYKPNAFLLWIPSNGTIQGGKISYESYNITIPSAGSWVNVPASDYVPPGTTGLILDLHENFTVDTNIRIPTCVINLTYKTNLHSTFVTGLASNLSFEAITSNLPNTNYTLRAYITPQANYTFLTNWIQFSPAVAGAWTGKDLSPYIPQGTTGVMLDVNISTYNNQTWGLRMPGDSKNVSSLSAYNLGTIGFMHQHYFVGVNSSRWLEYVAQSTAGVNFTLIGYHSANGTNYLGTSVNITPLLNANYTSWVPVNLASYVPSNATWLIFDVPNNANTPWGIRYPNDITEPANCNSTNHGFDITRCNNTQYVEVYAQNNQTQIWLTGYATNAAFSPVIPVNLTFSSMVSGSNIAPGNHNITMNQNATARGLYVDSVLVSSVAASATIPDNNSPWYFAVGRSIPALKYQRVIINGSAVQYINWTNNRTVFGGVMGNQTAYPTFPTGNSDSNMTVVFSNFGPLSPAQLTGYTYEAPPGMLPSPPTEPPETYAELNTMHLPGAEFVNNALTTADIPLALFWFPLSFGLAAILGLVVFGFTNSLLTQAIVSAFIMFFFALTGGGIIPWWTPIVFLVEALGIMIARKQISW